jgi:hypothetical protein
MAKAGKKLPKEPAAKKQLVFRLPPGELERLRREGEELQEARRTIDRMQAMRLRPWPAPGRRKGKPKRPGRQYDNEAILKIAGDLLRHYAELPRTLTAFSENVADACDACDDKQVDVPERSRFLEMLSPLYRQEQKRRRQGGIR